MRKSFASNPANASRTETDGAMYCSVHSTISPLKKTYSGRNADRCKAMLFLIAKGVSKNILKNIRNNRAVSRPSLRIHCSLFTTIA